jgi:hypothetical protein
MSDFLTRLAARALERPTLVPRLPTRFDTQPIELKELHEETVVDPQSRSKPLERSIELRRETSSSESTTSPQPPSASRNVPDRPIDTPAPASPLTPMSVEQRPPVEGPQTVIAPMTRLVEQRQEAEPPPSPPVLATDDRQSLAPVTPEAPLLHRIEHTLNVASPEPSRAPTPAPEVRRARPEPANSRSTSAPSIGTATQSEPLPLHVEVTIGRIEITAAPPHTPPVVSPRPAPPQPMGLDEHLRRRRGVHT